MSFDAGIGNNSPLNLESDINSLKGVIGSKRNNHQFRREFSLADNDSEHRMRQNELQPDDLIGDNLTFAPQSES